MQPPRGTRLVRNRPEWLVRTVLQGQRIHLMQQARCADRPDPALETARDTISKDIESGRADLAVLRR
jgi:hypothetical protein